MPGRWRTQSTSMQSLLVEACWRPVEGDAPGDFHDLIDLNDGRVVVVIGDVAGVGLAAAEKADDIRAELRRAFRRTDQPSHAFELVDARLEEAGPEVYATVALAVVDPGPRTVHVASAGHPPVLVADGIAARFLDGAVGPPLGIRRPRPTTERRLPTGAALFLYTDGLVERRRTPLDEALDVLVQVGRGLEGAAASAAALARRATGRLGPPPDDTTVVSVRFLSNGSPVVGGGEAPGRQPRVDLRVYVDSHDLRSTRVESIVNELALRTGPRCDVTVEVCDVSRRGIDTERDGILAAPTVVRVSPPPMVRVVGGLQSVDELACALHLPIAQEHLLEEG